MSLSIPVVPDNAVSALAVGLQQLVTNPTLARHLPRGQAAIKRFMTARTANPVAQPDLSLPWFVLSDVRKGIMTARQVGWRHLLQTGDSAGPALSDTRILASSQHVFAGLTESPFASDLEGRLAALRQDPTISAGTYNAVLLQVPACYVMAIWLQDTEDHDDLVVPVAPAPPPLTAGQRYSTLQFLDAIPQVRPSALDPMFAR
jgi:hypothetical protein